MTDRMEMIGVVLDHSRDIFRVKVDGTDQVVTAKLSGKMRQNKIDLQVGDRVKLEVSPYDTSMGRITFRINSARDNYVPVDSEERRDNNTRRNKSRGPRSRERDDE